MARVVSVNEKKTQITMSDVMKGKPITARLITPLWVCVILKILLFLYTTLCNNSKFLSRTQTNDGKTIQILASASSIVYQLVVFANISSKRRLSPKFHQQRLQNESQK